MRITKKFTARNGEIAAISGVLEFWQWADQHDTVTRVSQLRNREAICRHFAGALGCWWRLEHAA
ncbi:MAG: hypothetical protein OXR82_17505 [Gammaproteobacteria bacterium]|nr:hypothetical protein [Gammaproteobacteria bacterium]